MAFFAKTWKEWRGLVIFLVLMGLFRASVADWYEVPSGSMKPTIVEGDRIVVDKRAYDLRVPFTHIHLITWGNPHRGDIIVFDSKAAHERLVKRVVGVPGDVVWLHDNRLFINGIEATYRPADQAVPAGIWQHGKPLVVTEKIDGVSHEIALHSPYADFGPVKVPAGHYFVLGDNRDNSADSRYIGFVPRREILGRARGVAFSLNPDDMYLPRLSRTAEALR
jgi:signal peptidase I